ncbi:hypothetical protein MKX08_002269, partial [Trichoderma sp. CBMAI-0020]
MSGSRIAIIGVGQVGAAAAYALILGSVATELLLVDTNISLRDGYIGQTNLDYIYQNISIIKTIIDGMAPLKSDAILLIVSNPVDLLTSLALQLSRLPPSQVLGSGTYLDSMRLRGMLADRIRVAAKSIDLFVLGVQGGSQVTAWSTATIGGIPIKESLSKEDVIDRSTLSSECKHRSQSIVRAKGSTPFGIGSVISSICSSITLDKGTVYPISHFQPSFGCCFSLPVVLGKKGIQRKVQMPLTFDEDAQIADSAAALKKLIDQ